MNEAKDCSYFLGNTTAGGVRLLVRGIQKGVVLAAIITHLKGGYHNIGACTGCASHVIFVYTYDHHHPK